MMYQICFSDTLAQFIKALFPKQPVISLNHIHFNRGSIEDILNHVSQALASSYTKKGEYDIWYTRNSEDMIGFLFVLEIAKRAGIPCRGINCSYPIIEGDAIRIYDFSTEIEEQYLPYFYSHKEIISEKYESIISNLTHSLFKRNKNEWQFIKQYEFNYETLKGIKTSLVFWEKCDFVTFKIETLLKVIKSDHKSPQLTLYNYFMCQNIIISADYCLEILNDSIA